MSYNLNYSLDWFGYNNFFGAFKNIIIIYMLYTITIHKLIRNIKNIDWLTKNDLFVTIRFGDECRRTMVKWNNNRPIWNESFLFDIDITVHNTFLLEIGDEDNYSMSENIVTEEINVTHNYKFEENTDFLSISHGITNYDIINENRILKGTTEEAFKKCDMYEKIVSKNTELLETLKKNLSKVIHNNKKREK